MNVRLETLFTKETADFLIYSLIVHIISRAFAYKFKTSHTLDLSTASSLHALMVFLVIVVILHHSISLQSFNSVFKALDLAVFESPVEVAARACFYLFGKAVCAEPLIATDFFQTHKNSLFRAAWFLTEFRFFSLNSGLILCRSLAFLLKLNLSLRFFSPNTWLSSLDIAWIFLKLFKLVFKQL